MKVKLIFPNGGETETEVGYVPRINETCWWQNNRYHVVDVECFLDNSQVNIHLIDGRQNKPYTGDIPKMKFITPNG